MKLILSTLFSLLTLATFAQERPDPLTPQGENLQVPDEWIVRTDHGNDAVISSNADSADIYFVNMTPGWHITTGPAAIFYHPANTASGDFELIATIHLFNPGDRNREAYGVFFGGKNLDSEDQGYLYFLIRNTGEYLIKQRVGEETKVIQNWTADDAIVKYEDPEISSVKNDFKVQVASDSLTFYINDTRLTQVPRDTLQTDGIVGLRINHSINVHVSNLEVTEL